MVVHRVAVVADGSHGAPILFRRISIVRVSWCRGMRQLRRMLLCLGSDRSRQRPNVVFGPQAASGVSAAGIDDGISTEAVSVSYSMTVK